MGRGGNVNVVLDGTDVFAENEVDMFGLIFVFAFRKGLTFFTAALFAFAKLFVR